MWTSTQGQGVSMNDISIFFYTQNICSFVITQLFIAGLKKSELLKQVNAQNMETI